MSYIDTFDHEFLGFFANLPLYHPLEVVAESGRNDFGCTPANLVLGGGSGEHPALVLRSCEWAVACFLRNWLTRLNSESHPGKRSQELLPDNIWDDFIWSAFEQDDFEALDFVRWRVERYQAFYAACISMLRSPFDPATDGHFETWLGANLGEFIFYSMPQMIPQLDERLPQAKLRINHLLYGNILVPPPGYPIPAGRKTKDGVRVYGVVRWWSGADL